MNRSTAATRGAKNDDDDYLPLGRLPLALRSLALGFWALSPLDGGHLTGLVELRLAGCSFCAQELSTLVPELWGLRLLQIGWCHLGPHSGPEAAFTFSVGSSTLSRLEMWSCTTAGAGVTVRYAPHLVRLCAGVRPRDDGDGRLLQIDLRTPGALSELNGLMLYCHDVTFISAKNDKLGVRLHMATPLQIRDLLDLLRHLPNLRKLTTTRMDDTHPAEAAAAAQDAFHIQNLVMDAFRGGPSELSFASTVLAVAGKLTTLVLQPHAGLLPTQVSTASATLLQCPRASPHCEITLGHVPDA